MGIVEHYRIASLNLLDANFMPAGLTPSANIISLFTILNLTTFAACMITQAEVIVGLVPPILSIWMNSIVFSPRAWSRISCFKNICFCIFDSAEVTRNITSLRFCRPNLLLT